MTGLFCFFAIQADPAPLPVEAQGNGLAAKFSADNGIESHPSALLHETFESGALSQWTSHNSFPGTIEFDSKTVHTGAKSLKISYEPGKNSGGQAWKTLTPGVEKAYFRLYVFFPEDHGYIHHFVGLVGYNPPERGWRGRAGELPGKTQPIWFSTFLDLTGHGPKGLEPPPGRWTFYTYWLEMKGSNGVYYGNEPKHDKFVTAARGKWICAEFMIKCNTIGKADGEQAYWIDGQCVGRWGGYKWRTEEALNINGVFLEYYVTENTKRYYGVDPKPSRVYFDDIVVAREYIGPMKTALEKKSNSSGVSPFSRDFEPKK